VTATSAHVWPVLRRMAPARWRRQEQQDGRATGSGVRGLALVPARAGRPRRGSGTRQPPASTPPPPGMGVRRGARGCLLSQPQVQDTGLRTGCRPVRAHVAHVAPPAARWCMGCWRTGPPAGQSRGGHLGARFCRGLPPRPARRPGLDSGRAQATGRRLTAHTGSQLDAPERPAQPPQGDDLLLLFFSQDIAHLDGGQTSRRGQGPESAPLAGLEVTLSDRSWATTEGGAARQNNDIKGP